MIDLLYNDAHHDFIRRKTEQEAEKHNRPCTSGGI